MNFIQTTVDSRRFHPDTLHSFSRTLQWSSNNRQLFNSLFKSLVFFSCILLFGLHPVQAAPGTWNPVIHTWDGEPENITPLWGIEVELSDVDYMIQDSHGDKMGVLVNRHIDPDRQIPFWLPARDGEGFSVSHRNGDHQKDWDDLVAYRDQFFSTMTGYTTREKLSYLFKHIVDTTMEQAPTVSEDNMHPVDNIYMTNGFRGHCTGYANTFVALAGTLGIPGRNIAHVPVSGYSSPGHSTCEIYLDGAWHWVENTQYHVNSYEPFRNIWDCNFMELICATEYRSQLSGALPYDMCRRADTRFRTKTAKQWRMVFLEPKCKVNTYICGRELGALYPSKSTHYYQCQDEQPIMKITRGPENTAWWDGIHWWRMYQDDRLRIKFYLDDGNDLQSIHATLVYNSAYVPKDGGDWYIELNGVHIPLRELGGWPAKTLNNCEGVVRYTVTHELPIEDLVLGGTNELVLGCDSSGAQFIDVVGYADALVPYDPPVMHGDSGRSTSSCGSAQASFAIFGLVIPFLRRKGKRLHIRY